MPVKLNYAQQKYAALFQAKTFVELIVSKAQMSAALMNIFVLFLSVRK